MGHSRLTGVDLSDAAVREKLLLEISEELGRLADDARALRSAGTGVA